MHCPACARELVEVEASGVKLDVCRDGCGGIWFDNFEFKKFDEAVEPIDESLLNPARDPDLTVYPDMARHCPRCGDVVLRRHFASMARKVEVDECPACGGIWLDAGELAAIRNQFTTDEDRQKAMDDYFKKQFAKDFVALQGHYGEENSLLRRIGNIFGALLPWYSLSRD
ncbi:zf-TFIIB domain-containing protein [bacterium]|nr:zf-TFIIB domain-containing protein [bacterium]MCB9477055.1 zf-TFIIB domain-containing protein [Deltaproteobacteria bacterium]MCB9479677.1 zf-TFIIB domain-containing protein [Deltaproteobacteria bacterium]